MRVEDVNTQELTHKILESKKYRQTGLNPATIEDLVRQEAPRQASQKSLLKTVRRKLHNIVAPYLGEPDYDSYAKRLDTMIDTSPNSPEMQALCLQILKDHASTAERIPFLSEFYQRLFEETGTPNSILDLACGLHPFGIPWMNLPTTTHYHAYDIIQPRVDFINQFFHHLGMQPLAENRDILINPPQIQADLGIFFKEAHRFEKRQPGCNQAFWRNLKVTTLAISLPIQNLSGTHNLIEQHRSLVYQNLPGNHEVTELLFENEIIFLIKKPGQ